MTGQQHKSCMHCCVYIFHLFVLLIDFIIRHKCSYVTCVLLWQNGTSSTEAPLSGNPGYIVRQPVRAGHLTTNAAGVSYPWLGDRTGHNPPRSESPIQCQGRIKPTESLADLKAKFQDWRTSTPRYNNPLVQNHSIRWVLNQGVMSGGLCPPFLKFSFQNPLFCNRKQHRTLHSNSTGGLCPGGFVRPCHWQGVLTQGVYVRQSLDSHQTFNTVHLICCCW